MGILDEAIRQHLDLKRRMGAEEEELKRLEDEAFGPPSRPGDPDFPQSGEGEALGEEQGEVESAAEAPTRIAERPEQPTQPPPEATEPPADQPAEPGPDTAESQVVGEITEREPEDEQASAPAFFDQSQAEGDAAGEPEDSPGAEGGEAEAPADETQPPSEELEGYIEPPSEELEAQIEQPIESLDTVEHPFEEAIGDTGEGDAVGETAEAEAVEGEIEVEPDQQTADETSEEDVLEETPEFLRDQPEDDELWFEQGEPKDFDF